MYQTHISLNTTPNELNFIMMIGLPGSGKSTFAKELAESYNAVIHSSDTIREELFGNEEVQDNNTAIFDTLHCRVIDDLKRGKSVIYDATNISYKRRMDFLNRIKHIKCHKIACLMATPYKVCIKQNSLRDKKVPEHVIDKMLKRFDVPYWYEGWDAIHIEFSDNVPTTDLSSIFIAASTTFDQNNEHHSLTPGEHCLKCRNILMQQGMTDTVIMAGKLHDEGKLFCKTFVDSKGKQSTNAHYYGHEHVGSYNSLFMLDYNNNCINGLEVAILIRWHMQLYFIKDNIKALEKYKRLWGEDLYHKIEMLHKADMQAH